MEDLIERARAIEIIHELQDSQTFDQTADMAYDLVDWAISEIPSAQPETHEERTETHACDLISRQAAIDAHYEYCNKHPDASFPVWSLKILKDLPSAQPDSKELSFTQKKLDTISRQAAIRWVKTECNPYGKPTLDFESGKKVIEHLKQMPSAQPETHEKCTETHACDLISRQAAIDALDCISGVEEVLRSLPSAQSEPIRINLNEPIKVKLTDWGKEIYYHQYDRTNQIAGREICKPMFPREDENGYTEFQLWCFIELYGMHMGMTLPNVIEPLEIVYER